MGDAAAGVGLEPRTGSAREALTSLYSIFETTRSVLRNTGPDIAQGPKSLGPLAIDVLNTGLRPFVVKWHSRLSAFERNLGDERRQRFSGISEVAIDESQWEHIGYFYEELTVLRDEMLTYVTALAQIAGVYHSYDKIGGDTT